MDAKHSLCWNGAVGYIPEHPPVVFDFRDFEQHCEKEQNVLFRKLVQYRVKMIQQALSYRKYKNHCLDIWIKGGCFVREMNRITDIETQGIDVNARSIKWLNDNDWMSNRESYEMLTFWESFDKINEPDRYIINYKPKFIALSIPIFKHKEHILNSFYFDPFQRFWYFTKIGIIDWMKNRGFSLLKSSTDDDIVYGQQDVQSFVFAANSMI